MFLYVRSLDAVVFSYLAKYHRKTDELVVETYIKLIFFGIKVEVGQEIVLHLFFYSYLLLHKADHIGLIYHELRLGYFIALNYFLFHLYNMFIRLLLVNCFGRFMY